jgi:hypothetical protein
MHALHADRVLHRKRRNGRQWMAAEAGQRQDVGLNAGAGGRVAGGKDQHLGRAGGLVELEVIKKLYF